MDVKQQPLHVLGPLLLVLPPRSFQLPQMVRIAESMSAGVPVVGLPVVMAQHAREAGQNAHRLHGGGPALGMGHEPREGGRGGHVQPVACPSNVDARLIHMQEVGPGQLSGHPRLKALQSLIGFLIKVEDGARTHRNVQLILEVIAHPIIGDQLILGHVDGVGLHGQPILNRPGHAIGKGGDHPMAMPVFQDLRPVFGHDAGDLEIDDLAGFIPRVPVRIPDGKVWRSTVNTVTSSGFSTGCRVAPVRPGCPPGLRGLVPCLLSLVRLGSADGGWLLLVLVRVTRLSSSLTSTSKTSRAARNAGDRLRACASCVFTASMAASTSSCSIFTDLHPHPCRQNTTSFSDEIFVLRFPPETRKKDERLAPWRSGLRPLSEWLSLSEGVSGVEVPWRLRVRKNQKTMSSTFFIFFGE